MQSLMTRGSRGLEAFCRLNFFCIFPNEWRFIVLMWVWDALRWWLPSTIDASGSSKLPGPRCWGNSKGGWSQNPGGEKCPNSDNVGSWLVISGNTSYQKETQHDILLLVLSVKPKPWSWGLGISHGAWGWSWSQSWDCSWGQSLALYMSWSVLLSYLKF